ncbi:MAG: hypothetical protein QXE81_03140 [Desulfurococcaceae archaeon]
MRNAKKKVLTIFILIVYIFVSSTPSFFSSSGGHVLMIGIRGVDDSLMRIKPENDLIYSILVEGYGYGKYIGNQLCLDALGGSYLVTINEQGNLVWAKKVDDQYMYKSRGFSIYGDTLFYAYSTIDQSSKGRIVIIKLNKEGNISKAVSVEGESTIYHGQVIPWIVNDMIMDNEENLYLIGGWHLTAQPYPYSLSPYVLIFDKELTRGVRMTIKSEKGFYVSGMFNGIDMDDNFVCACGSIIDIYESGSRGDFTIIAFDRKGLMQWIKILDFSMGADYCRCIRKHGEYLYMVCRSWFNSFGDHLVFVKTKPNGDIVVTKFIKYRGEPLALSIDDTGVYVLIGHGLRNNLIKLSLDGDIEWAVEFRNTLGGLDMVIMNNSLLLSGAIRQEDIDGVIMSIRINQLRPGELLNGIIEIIDITQEFVTEEVNVNHGDSTKLNIEQFMVYPSSYYVNIIDVTEQFYENIQTNMDTREHTTTYTKDQTRTSTGIQVTSTTNTTNSWDQAFGESNTFSTTKVISPLSYTDITKLTLQSLHGTDQASVGGSDQDGFNKFYSDIGLFIILSALCIFLILITKRHGKGR